MINDLRNGCVSHWSVDESYLFCEWGQGYRDTKLTTKIVTYKLLWRVSSTMKNEAAILKYYT